MLWSVSIAFTLYKAFLKEDANFSSQHIYKHAWTYNGVCWGFPALMTLLPLSTESYGDTGGWCWLVNDDAGITWRFFQFYLPLWAAVGFNAYVYYGVHRKLVLLNEEAIASGNPMTTDTSLIERIKFYPLVLIVCWFFGSINAVWESTGSVNYFLNCLTIFFSSAMPIGNALVYGFTPAVSNRVKHGMW